ncbi:MAG: valine--tRNA ligase [Patescibacteria group bacterium]
MHQKFLKPYNPQKTEEKIYKLWEESGFFNPDNLPPRHQKPYSMVLPPPNVTGKLHIGHADMLAIQDTAIRFQRMRGKKTLWLPGTDHAAIATQTKVEKILAKEKIKKHDLGREKFLDRVNEFAMDSQKTIITQTKSMGSSLDWSRLAFTLDKERNLAVKTAFKKMYDDNLIYRKNKVINWDPKGQTVISDDEVIHQDRTATLYTFKYSKDFPIAISTTRPETKVGDTAIAVNPQDKKYQKYVGKSFEIENFCGVKLSIKIITDREVDAEFGTGALGVTPAHSKIDEKMALENNLPSKQVINEYAQMQNAGEILNGKKVTEARETVVDWLRKENLMLDEKEIEQSVATAERSGAIIEPLPKLQWFIDVNKKFKLPHSKIKGVGTTDEVSLKDLMKHAVQSGEVKILPDHFNKTYYHWIDNLQDWCISRQIWYGHQIPIWYRNKSKVKSQKSKVGQEEIFVGLEAPTGESWEQDPDTLDTWFSSGLWTFSTLGWPKQTADLKLYHPTDLLETAHDILFFWVARMILMSSYLLGEIPFKTVYIHGLVRDNKNQKFSKSLGNAIDPLDMIEKYGADALRMALVVAVAPGQDVKFNEDKVGAYKKFANKLWNISRFILENTQSLGEIEPTDERLNALSRSSVHLQNLQKIVADITADMDNYRFYLASEKIYHFVWHTFADIIIEESKQTLNETDTQFELLQILQIVLKVLHPFMPFITEEIWSEMPFKNKKLLMIEEWPV